MTVESRFFFLKSFSVMFFQQQQTIISSTSPCLIWNYRALSITWLYDNNLTLVTFQAISLATYLLHKSMYIYGKFWLEEKRERKGKWLRTDSGWVIKNACSTFFSTKGNKKKWREADGYWGKTRSRFTFDAGDVVKHRLLNELFLRILKSFSPNGFCWN